MPKIHALHYGNSQDATEHSAGRSALRYGLEIVSTKHIQSDLETEVEKLKLLLSSKEEDIACKEEEITGLRQLLSGKNSSAQDSQERLKLTDSSND